MFFSKHRGKIFKVAVSAAAAAAAAAAAPSNKGIRSIHKNNGRVGTLIRVQRRQQQQQQQHVARKRQGSGGDGGRGKARQMPVATTTTTTTTPGGLVLRFHDGRFPTLLVVEDSNCLQLMENLAPPTAKPSATLLVRHRTLKYVPTDGDPRSTRPPTHCTVSSCCVGKMPCGCACVCLDNDEHNK